jgi:hypothetical protein
MSELNIKMPNNFDQILMEVCKEYNRSTIKHIPFFRSTHEGYAVIKEELEELWEEIKKDNYENIDKEAVQLCAMALKFLLSNFK